jgi:hypothetical protein
MKEKLCVLAAGAAAVAAIVALPAGAGDNNSGFHTTMPALLAPLAPGSSVTPIISVGDSVRGYRFESIPDGISFTRNGQGTMASTSTTRRRSCRSRRREATSLTRW